MTLFRAKAFLAGVVAGTIALAVVGASVTPPHLVEGFRRFTVGFNTRWFFATARELKAILDRVPRDKIVVVVGGTSVLQGATQAGNMVWTDVLQRALGDRYAVLNMAQRAGAANETGNLVAEMALNEHRPVIYLCDAVVDHLSQFPHLSRYQPIVFDAWRRGYLLDWAPRNAAMRGALWSEVPTLRGAAWGSLIDRALHFRDLWNFVAFEWTGTIWNTLDRSASFTALRHVADPEPTPDFIRTSLPHLRDVKPRDLALLRSLLHPPDSDHWAVVETLTETDFPPPLRDVTLALVSLDNPAFLEKLTAEERDRFAAQARAMAALIERSGFRKVLTPEDGFSAGDFNDYVHLTVEGGGKLAALLAPEIEIMAQVLGYQR